MRRRVAHRLVVSAVTVVGFASLAMPAAGEPPVRTDVELRPLSIPVDNVTRADLRDTFNEGRPGHPHAAIDIPAPRGTRVFAVDDGRLVKLFSSVPGGLTVYQFDSNGDVAYYYAHLDRYADGIKEGMMLRRCDLVGYVGSTGNAPANVPHLHFAVFRLGPAREWWKGTPVDPYAALGSDPSTACKPQVP